MAQFNITDLDFDSIKENFKNYLKSQEKFKDYNFDGSSMSVFLDILAYNTFYNSFYTNIIANEMFLDSATDRGAVVSRAKALGYVSDSSTSSYVYVDLEARIAKVSGEDPPTSESVASISQYAEFTTSVQDKEYSFLSLGSIPLKYEEDGIDYWIYRKRNVRIAEGKNMTYSWKVQNDFDKYIIPNAGVDMSSLAVRVRDSESSTANTTFNRAGSILDIGGTDPVYWIYEDQDEKFYIEFGNDLIGKKVNIGNVIDIDYILTNGSEANGAKTFTVGNYQYANSSIQEVSSLTATNSTYVVLTVYGPTSDFTVGSFIRGLTNDATAYVFSYDSTNFVLKLYSKEGEFSFGETIREETTIGSEIVYGAMATISTIQTEESVSTGGTDIESTANIKFYAPKVFGAQNRMITASDYEAVIKNEYPYVAAVVAWGGEEMDPQELGHVYVAARPASKETLDAWEKDFILDTIIEPRKVIGLNVHIIDPDYIYIKPSVDLKYNTNIPISETQEGIVDQVRTNISNFNSTYLDKFNSTFYYSPFSTTIDDANQYILGNISEFILYKNFKPILDFTYSSSNTAILEFSNPISEFNEINGEFVLDSTTFTANVSGTLYPGCTLEIASFSDFRISVANSSAVVVSNAGAIDRTNGIIEIDNLNIHSTDTKDSSNNSIIKVYVIPESRDFVSSKQQILKIVSDYDVTATAIRTMQ